MPTKAKELLDMLGVDEGKRRFEDARFNGDFEYGTPKEKVGKGAWDSLFPPLVIET